MAQDKPAHSVRKSPNGESFNTKLPLKMSRATPNSAITEPAISCLLAFSFRSVSKDRAVVSRGVMQIIKATLVV